VTKEQKALLAEVDAIDAEFPTSEGERRGELLTLRDELIHRSDVAEALGAREVERRAKEVREQYAGAHPRLQAEVEHQLANVKDKNK
jgi:hypothetical protein